MNKSKRLMKLVVWVGVISVTTPLIMPAGVYRSVYACDSNQILSVRIAPDPVNIPIGGTAQVTVTITCFTNGNDFREGSTLSEGGTASFKFRLIDEDTGLRGGDETLGTATFTMRFGPLGTFKKQVTATNVFPLCCISENLNTVRDASCGADSGEGAPPCRNPADLAVEIDNGDSEKNANYYNGRVFKGDDSDENMTGQTVNACCVPTETGAVPGAAGQAFASAGRTLSTTQPVATAGVLSGPHWVSSDVIFDPLGHLAFIGNLPGNVNVGFDSFKKNGQRSIAIRGAAPWVNVTGSVAEDGSVMATGRGTVAGFPNIAVTFQGKFLPGGLAGDYTMGAGGGLPGGQPIIYRVEGQDIDWAGFWRIVGMGFQQAAQGIARLNFRTDLGGIDFSTTTMPLAGEFFKAESGVLFEERQFTVEALSAIADRLTQLATSVSTSSLSNAAALEAQLRESASAFAAAAALKQQINERIQRVGDLDLINLMNEWIGALARAGETLQSVGRLLAQIN